MDVVAIASRVPALIFSSKSDDDFSDRLNYRYTVALLVLFAVVVGTRQFSTSNISCWTPAFFTSVYEDYVSRICYMSNTYYLNASDNIPREGSQRQKNEIRYYQWVTFILLFQALAFYMPRILWKSFSLRSGLDLSDLVDAASNYKSADKFEEREKYMRYLVTNIDQYVDDPRRYDENRPLNIIKRTLIILMPFAGRFLGNYIVILYFITKVVYVLNTIFQMLIISSILDRNFFQFGFEFIQKIMNGYGWTMESRYFPKVTFCDFHVREIGNLNKTHRYTVQCVLPINLFNQQIFIVIWFWFLLILVWNIIELFIWISRCLPTKSNSWITRRVQLVDENVKKDSNNLSHFINVYLEPDGIFMIRIIANNTNDFVATDLILQLWKRHIEKYKQFKQEYQERNRMSIKYQSDIYDDKCENSV